jgi:hypothetical protein
MLVAPAVRLIRFSMTKGSTTAIMVTPRPIRPPNVRHSVAGAGRVLDSTQGADTLFPDRKWMFSVNEPK